jgi:histidinol-phosphatase (PHP family)
MLIDCHLHSTISPDGKSSIGEMCRSAVRKGVSVICFTEHFDLNPADSTHGYYNHEKYISEMEQAKAFFGEKIEILLGIEFSEPHQYPEDFEIMMKRNFDYVLGSMHSIGDTWAGAADILQKYSAEEVFEMHYTETLKMVQFGGFDALAHMDFPRRFISEYKEPNHLIGPILATLIKSNVALELNSSPWNRGRDFSLPSPAILQKYRDLGGKFVTMGSDAHNADEICSGFEHLAAQTAFHQLEPVVYRKRKPYPMEGGGD